MLNPRLALMTHPHRSALARLLAMTDVVILNREELGALTNVSLAAEEEVLRRSVKMVQDMGPRVVIVTCAECGSFFFEDNDPCLHEPTRIIGDRIHDEIGAGDAFFAGIIIARRAGWSYAQAMPLAALMAGHAMSGPGGSFTVSRETIERSWGKRLIIG